MGKNEPLLSASEQRIVDLLLPASFYTMVNVPSQETELCAISFEQDAKMGSELVASQEKFIELAFASK